MRQYTYSKCMAAAGSQILTKNFEESKTVTLTVKDYKTSVSRMLNYDGSGQFKISGPFGPGLQISPNQLNIVFAAGTGVLPFCDLISSIMASRS